MEPLGRKAVRCAPVLLSQQCEPPAAVALPCRESFAVGANGSRPGRAPTADPVSEGDAELSGGDVVEPAGPGVGVRAKPVELALEGGRQVAAAISDGGPSRLDVLRDYASDARDRGVLLARLAE